MKNKVIQAFRTYLELFRTGGIQCTADGENVTLCLHANLCGDILIFVGPRNHNAHPGKDVLELLRTDHMLEQQGKAVIEAIRQKFRMLTFLPVGLAWLINVIILYITYFHLNLGYFLSLIDSKNPLAQILNYLPLILPLLTLFYGKSFGFMLMKPLMYIIIRIARLIRLIRNRKVD